MTDDNGGHSCNFLKHPEFLLKGSNFASCDGIKNGCFKCDKPVTILACENSSGERFCIRHWKQICNEKNWDHELGRCANEKVDNSIISEERKNINQFNIIDILNLSGLEEFGHIASSRRKRFNDIVKNTFMKDSDYDPNIWIKRRKRKITNENINFSEEVPNINLRKEPLTFPAPQVSSDMELIISEIEAIGGNAIRGDTDSIFFRFDNLSSDDFIQMCKNIVSKYNIGKSDFEVIKDYPAVKRKTEVKDPTVKGKTEVKDPTVKRKTEVKDPAVKRKREVISDPVKISKRAKLMKNLPLKGKRMMKGVVEPLNPRNLYVINPINDLLKSENLNDPEILWLQFRDQKAIDEFYEIYEMRNILGGEYWRVVIPLKDIPKLKDDLRITRVEGVNKLWLH